MKKNLLLKKIGIFAVGCIIIFLPLYILRAQGSMSAPNTSGSCGSGTICNPLGSNNGDLATFLKNLLTQIAKLAAMVAIIMIILTGFRFVLAQGVPEKIKTAKTQLYYVIIGTAIILAASVIVDIITNTISSLSS